MKFQVEGVSAASEINEQPIGFSETLLGAQNRAKNALLSWSGEACFLVVSIENGLWPMGEPDEFDLYYDTGLVYIQSGVDEKKHANAFSTGITFPKSAIVESKKLDWRKTTAGSVLAKQESALNAKDPHHTLCSGLVNRGQMLTQATLAALGSYFYLYPVLD
eukprot:CAMPEP_0201549336 /NCGR_PEP_ID=MMETSP0173_2-20130828/5830_1 /ASSEMBLY_ACC=CAM_ASM_000268 /TAXON_ID=218659 /ORGANISM="Vexillifera sp., Strain DIVA3 564/2" /LENGTH=161 /DNA_ID=CAMNT_0047958979 /DNA_START=54 /DNA_END=539 /DNA_ORIENTATION=+